jgi:hypothetical protein
LKEELQQNPQITNYDTSLNYNCTNFFVGEDEEEKKRKN